MRSPPDESLLRSDGVIHAVFEHPSEREGGDKSESECHQICWSLVGGSVQQGEGGPELRIRGARCPRGGNGGVSEELE